MVSVWPVVAKVDDPVRFAFRLNVPAPERVIEPVTVDVPFIVTVAVLFKVKVVLRVRPLDPIVVVPVETLNDVPENPFTFTVEALF